MTEKEKFLRRNAIILSALLVVASIDIYVGFMKPDDATIFGIRVHIASGIIILLVSLICTLLIYLVWDKIEPIEEKQ